MKILTTDLLERFLDTLSLTWEVRLPVLLADGTRVIGSPGDGPAALQGEAILSKPTAAFFPQHGTIFTAAANGELQQTPPPERPLFVFGFTPRDLACLRFIDRFFAAGWRDDIYFRQRDNAIVAGLSGYCGPDGALLPPAGDDCDLELFWDGECWLVLPYSEAGSRISAELPDAPEEAAERFRQAAMREPDENDQTIRRASTLLRADRVPDTFWQEIGDRCIACSSCNLACPTCTCFGVQDWRSAKQIERSRMWDSCQLDGFMREAGGHNPLGSEALRTRRRIHHKLAADAEKWGEISCFICGRCDAVCPTGIGIIAVAREMVARFG